MENAHADIPEIVAGYRHIQNGSIVPNGRPPSARVRGLVDFSTDFSWPEILSWTTRAGLPVREVGVESVVNSGRTWFYFLRPVALPKFGPVLAALSADVREDVERGRCYIVIDYSRQGYSDWIFPLVYEGIGEAHIPPSQVIVLCADMNCERAHAAFVEARGLSPVHLHYVNVFRQTVADAMRRPPAEHGCSGHERKRYLCLNRRNRVHRQLLVSRLLRDGVLDAGLVSMPTAVEGLTNEERFQWEKEHLSLPMHVVDELASTYPRLASILPLMVDEGNLNAQLVESYPEWPYDCTGFSLVTETLMFGSPPGQLFITEKVWKAIKERHPFIVFGHAGILSALRDMGVQTFAPFIDESYDGIADHGARFDAAYREACRLAAMPDDEFRTWRSEFDDTLEHNYQLLRGTNECDSLVAFWKHYLPA